MITDAQILASLNAAYLRQAGGTANGKDKENIAYAQSTHKWTAPKLMTMWQPRTGEKKVALASDKLPVGYQLWTAGNATHADAVKAVEAANKKRENETGAKWATIWNVDTGEKRVMKVGDPFPSGFSLWTGGMATGSDARAAIMKKAAAEALRTNTQPKLSAKVSLNTLASVHGAKLDDENYSKDNPNNVLAVRDAYAKKTYGGDIAQDEWSKVMTRKTKHTMLGYEPSV